MNTRTLLAVCLCALGAWGGAARADDPHVEIFGTIVSLRSNILAIRPSLRPKMTRVSFGDKTDIIAAERASASVLKPGMRVAMGGSYSEQDGFSLRWAEAADKPMGRLKQKSVGIQNNKEQGFAFAMGTLKSVQPFVFVDDAGKEFTAKTDNLRGVWHDSVGDRNELLIGVRVFIVGKVAPDGVIQAESISPDKDYARAGTMFGTILSVKGDTIEVRPRYTEDTLPVVMPKTCTLLRQNDVDPDSIKVGDSMTFWGMPKRGTPQDVLAIALMLGKNRYPASQGDAGGVFVTGKLAALEPSVKLTSADGKSYNIIIPAQMPVVRLEKITEGDLKPGAQVMLVLSRRPDGSFQTTTVVINASPWVGYGG